jgi:hypothetical protein
MQPPNGVPWTGAPERLTDGFTIKKSKGVITHVAVCEVWTNPHGWELRLAIDGLSLTTTTVVRSANEMRALVETWRSSMLERGWS